MCPKKNKNARACGRVVAKGGGCVGGCCKPFCAQYGQTAHLSI